MTHEQQQAQDAAAFFSPAANTVPYFKAGFQGFAGSGKTYTMALLAIALHKRIGSSKPVVMFDTEKASRFLLPLFSRAGVQLLVKESRSLADLQKSVSLCEGGAADVLLIDSLSHIWENFLEAYKAKVKRTRLEFQDWGTIKPTWKQTFSDPFVRARVHILFSGRAGYEYENEKNPDTGKREIFKSGIKMKVEGETAYEPDMLVLMERYEHVLEDEKQVWREATILKDRSGILDGKTLKNPMGDDFMPVVDFLLSNPADAAVQLESDDRSLFDTSEDGEKRKLERRICLEEIVGELEKAAPGQTVKEKKFRGDMLEKHFGTRSWTFIEARMSLENLALGLDALRADVRRIAAEVAAAEGEGIAPDLSGVAAGEPGNGSGDTPREPNGKSDSGPPAASESATHKPGKTPAPAASARRATVASPEAWLAKERDRITAEVAALGLPFDKQLEEVKKRMVSATETYNTLALQ